MSMIECVELRFEREAASCQVFGSPPGPAGLVDLELGDDLHLAVDVAEPDRLVELTVMLPDSDPEAAVPQETVALVTRLLGESIGSWVARPASHRPTTMQVSCTPTTALRVAGRLALLERLREEEHDPSPWWAGEAAMLATRIGPELLAYAREQAFAAAPMLAAYAEVPGPWWHALDEPVTDRLRMIADAVSRMLADMLLGPTNGVRTEQMFHGVLTLSTQLLTPRPDSVDVPGHRPPEPRNIPGPIEHPGDDAEGLRGVPILLPSPWSRAVHHRTVVRVEHFRDLVTHVAYQALVPSAKLEVSWSPRAPVRVTVPIQSHARPEHFDDLFVRVFDAETGALLGAAELQPSLRATMSSRTASAQVVLPHRYGTGPHARTPTQLAFDLTSRPQVPPDTIARHHRQRALRAGFLAAQATRTAALARAEQGWHACAGLWHELGRHDLGRQAESYAAAVRAMRDAGSAPPATWMAGEYLPSVLGSWVAQSLRPRPDRGHEEADGGDLAPPTATTMVTPAVRGGRPERPNTGASRHEPQPAGLALAHFAFLARRKRPAPVPWLAGLLTRAGELAVRHLKLGVYWTIAASAALSGLVGGLVLLGQPRVAGLVLLAEWFFEVLDGPISRRALNLRAIYVDQVVDRFVEGVLFSTITVYAIGHDQPTLALFSFLTLIAALITSFERAQADALRFRRGSTSFGRIVRWILLVPALLTPWTLLFMIAITAVTFLSLAWRLGAVWLEWQAVQPTITTDVRMDPTVLPPRLEEFPSIDRTSSSEPEAMTWFEEDRRHDQGVPSKGDTGGRSHS